MSRVRVDAVVARLARAEKGGMPFLTRSEVLAAERFGRDFEFAGLQPAMTQSYDPTPKSPRGGPDDRGADAAIDARTRVGRALSAVGPELAGIIVDVCGLQRGLEAVERERTWPVRSGKLVLKLALSALARHYGYGDKATGPEPAVARTRAWLADGARPSIRPGPEHAAHRP